MSDCNNCGETITFSRSGHVTVEFNSDFSTSEAVELGKRALSGCLLENAGIVFVAWLGNKFVCVISPKAESI